MYFYNTISTYNRPKEKNVFIIILSISQNCLKMDLSVAFLLYGFGKKSTIFLEERKKNPNLIGFFHKAGDLKLSCLK